MPLNVRPQSGGASSFSGEGGLTIVVPTHYQNHQRDVAANKGVIPISGTYTGNPAAIEARWSGGSWVTIDANPDNGTFSGSLTELDPGQGTLEVRFTNHTANVRSISFVGVGDVIVLAGQSNCVGGLENFQTYSNAITATFFSKGYKWKPVADPMHLNDAGHDSVYGALGANSTGGSYWTLLADLMMDTLGFPVSFIPCAKVGINITEFAPGADHLDRTTLYGAMLYRTIQAGGARAVFWHQGETNWQDSQAVYYARLNAVADPFADDTETYTGIRTKFIPCKLQRHADYPVPEYDTIGLAIQQFWDNNPDAMDGADLGSIHLNGVDDDGLHITSDAQGVSAASLWDTALTGNGFY